MSSYLLKDLFLFIYVVVGCVYGVNGAHPTPSLNGSTTVGLQTSASTKATLVPIQATSSSDSSLFSVSTSSPSPAPPTVQPPPKVHCNGSTSCSSCTDDVKCYWCSSTNRCEIYNPKDVVPRDCSSKHWYWKQCTISGRILIIVVPSVVALFLLICGCFIYCKCCRKKKNYAKEDNKVQRRKEERRQKEMQRKSDRKERTDEIRRKYGLLKDEDEEPLI